MLIGYSKESTNAHAVLSDGNFLSVSDTLSIFGDTINCKVYRNGEYITVPLYYTNNPNLVSGSIQSVDSDSTFDSVAAGRPVICYESSSIQSATVDPAYITLDISPTYSIFGTYQIHTFIACQTQSDVSAAAYTSPSWDWVVNGSGVHVENSTTKSNGSYLSTLTRQVGSSNYQKYTFVPFDFNSQSEITGYSVRAVFYGNNWGNNKIRILLGCPYVSSGAQGSAGAVYQTTASGGSGGGSSSTEINVNVDVDMSETNGLLDSMLDWFGDFFSDLWDFVDGLFVPSEGFFDNWVDEIIDTLTDEFLPHIPLHEQLDDIVNDLLAALGGGAAQTVTFPAISVPGTSFSLPAYSVPLVPNGYENVVEYLKTFIDVICTVWVFNMIINRIHGLIVGETSVEVITDAD